MNFYWVNQANFNEEAELGVIKADISSSDHARQRILAVERGDVVFSFAAKGLQAVLVSEGKANTNGNISMVECDYNYIDTVISIPSVVEMLSGYLDGLYSPINAKGGRNQGYLYPLSEAAGNILLEVTGFTVEKESSVSDEDLSSNRSAVFLNRIIRDTKVSKKVKKLYRYTCQVCNVPLNTLSGPYAEGAHIIPLGRPHNGPDTFDNILCLCPNHHILFDSFSFSISDDGKLIGLDGEVHVNKSHSISKESLKWHRAQHNQAVKLKL